MQGLPNSHAGGGAKGRCLVLVAPILAVLAVMLTASRPATVSGAEIPALKSISSRLDGAVSTVLIEASEPVAY